MKSYYIIKESHSTQKATLYWIKEDDNRHEEFLQDLPEGVDTPDTIQDFLAEKWKGHSNPPYSIIDYVD